MNEYFCKDCNLAIELAPEEPKECPECGGELLEMEID